MTDENEPVPPLDEEMDRTLREAYAFAPDAAEAAAARFRVPAPRAPRWPWLALPVAAAAGILAGLSFRAPVQVVPPHEPPNPPRAVAFLTQATKPLTSGGRGAIRAGHNLVAGMELEVPEDGRATLVYADGTEVRLDRGCRIAIPGGRGLDLAAGRVWSRVSPGDPFLLSAGDAKVSVLGTELGVHRASEGTEVQLYSGKARVEAAGTVRDLAAGQEVELADGRLSEPRRFHSEAIATGWMLELVAHAGNRDRELAEHVDRLLVDMGRTKAVMIQEETLARELGGTCRVPLARYLVSEGAQADLEPRRKAARVLVRIADASVARDLATALRDPDAEVRVSAAQALRRVSAGQVCGEPEAFRGACDDGAAHVAKEWIEGGCSLPPK
jgi:hypothetical protein